MNKQLLIFGAREMVGSALVRTAEARGITDILVPTSGELDLCNQAATEDYLAKHQLMR